MTGGLSATDLGQFQIIGGYARDFYTRAAAHYGTHTLEKHADWLSEPHVGEEIFRAMLNEAGVEVHFREKLAEHGGVSMASKHVTSIKTMDGKVWRAKVFADCSYEGDVMSQSGVTYTIGREEIAKYGEDLAGVRDKTRASSSRGRSMPTTISTSCCLRLVRDRWTLRVVATRRCRRITFA